MNTDGMINKNSVRDGEIWIKLGVHVSNKRTRVYIWVDLLSANVRLFEFIVRIPRFVLITAHVSNNRTLVTFFGLHKQPRMRGNTRNGSITACTQN